MPGKFVPSKPEKLLKPRTKQRGYIYLIRADSNSPQFKIGRTKNLPSRLKPVGLQLPWAVELLHAIEVEDIVWAEIYLHKKFDPKRLNGEWFSLLKEDVEWFCSLQIL
jgi:hypothetical protein